MSIGDIIGVPGAGNHMSIPVYPPVGTSTVEASDVERLRCELRRARELAVAIEAVAAEREALLWLAISEPSSHAEGQIIGRRIAAHLRDSGCQPPSVPWIREQRGVA